MNSTLLHNLSPKMENPSNKNDEEEEGELPHEALFLVLAYLPLFELLSAAKVCKSLRDAVESDTLLWLHIKVQKPLNYRLTDDVLMRIASKSHGRMKTLALINCVKITDAGLQRVVDQNPLIDKLHLPRCTSLTPDGIIRAVETLTKPNHKLTTLKIDGIPNITKQHLEILQKNIIGSHPKPIFFHKSDEGSNSSSCCPPFLDVDLCPVCDQVRMVFDCPRDNSCGGGGDKGLMRQCRGCFYCIPRCNECGKCVETDEPVEAACEDSLCLDCWLQLPKCSFCNRPYCSKHTDLRHYLVEGCHEFVCDVCHMKESGDEDLYD